MYPTGVLYRYITLKTRVGLSDMVVGDGTRHVTMMQVIFCKRSTPLVLSFRRRGRQAGSHAERTWCQNPQLGINITYPMNVCICLSVPDARYQGEHYPHTQHSGVRMADDHDYPAIALAIVKPNPGRKGRKAAWLPAEQVSPHHSRALHMSVPVP